MLCLDKVTIPDKIEKAIFGFMVSHVLFTTQKIGVFDALMQSSRTSEKLANLCFVPHESMERLLLACVSAGFLSYKNGEFSIEESLQSFFQSGGLTHFKERFAHYEKTTVKLFQYLEAGIRENSQQWYKVDPNFNQDNLFASIYQDNVSTESFLENMWALGFHDSVDLCKKFGFSEFAHLVDVGGATGSFAIPALISNPNLTAVIFDHEKVEQHFIKKRDEYDLAHRLFFNSGDFFKDELPEGDLYSLGYILSDWKEDQCCYLLKKIFDKLPSNGALVVLEKVFNEDMCGPFTTAMMNINMLLETYGKHRSFAQYNTLLRSVGFTECQIIRSNGEKHMIIARK